MHFERRKKYNFMHFDRRNAFQMHKIIFFSRKKIIIKKICVHHLKFLDMLPETHLFFYLA